MEAKNNYHASLYDSGDTHIFGACARELRCKKSMVLLDEYPISPQTVSAAIARMARSLDIRHLGYPSGRNYTRGIF